MEIKNLTENDVIELEKKIVDLKKGNSDITYRVYEIPNVTIFDEVKEILDRLKTLQQSVDLIFADHVLIDGKWQNTNKIAQIMNSKP